MELMYYSINAYCLITALFIFLSIIREHKRNSPFIYAEIALIGVILVFVGDCLSYFANGKTDNEIYFLLNKIGNFSYFFFGFVGIILSIVFLFKYFKFKVTWYKLILVFAPGVLLFSLLVASQFIPNMIYYFDADNNYVRQSLFLVQFFGTIYYYSSLVVMSLIKMIKTKNAYHRRTYLYIFLAMFMPFAGVILQFYFIWNPFTWPFVVLGFTSVYVILRSQNNKTDFLTGVYIKGIFVNLVTEKKLKKGHQAFVVFDLDHFKNVNDTYGHFVGDIVLKLTGDNLNNYFNTHAVVGRIGGDEFGLFVDHIENEDDFLNKIKIFLDLEKQSLNHIVNISISCSAGICFNDKGEIRSFSEFFMKADTALYYVKKYRKSNYSAYINVKTNSTIKFKPYLIVFGENADNNEIILSLLITDYIVLLTHKIKEVEHYLNIYPQSIGILIFDINSPSDIERYAYFLNLIKEKNNLKLIAFSKEEFNDNLKNLKADAVYNKPFDVNKLNCDLDK